ncbi:hypothetical protein GCM10027176_69940 [Actinoallomurus bryophytorum]|uniref:DNA-binding SARP family transcriptional activator n=1 Tax=Actinoallomurus bryophytorum TaxID=1490222 RepID=A0A543CUB1_9ACTN|nr:AfsR/SARP family transcriptional regulator [Actinoallomurus bryophytorum]TQM00686.1 DNA-binding SARP family transcriptional activator [Actinoallomurus bryophytorum]
MDATWRGTSTDLGGLLSAVNGKGERPGSSIGPWREKAGLRFGLLGAVTAWQDGAELDLGSPQQRAVLAHLLLRDGGHVPLGELIDSLWGDDVPRGARSTVRTYIYRLRRLLDPAVTDGHMALLSQGPGYSILVDPARVDLTVFQQCVADGKAAWDLGDIGEADRWFEQAKTLWRGDPLMGVSGRYFDGQRDRLDRLRSTVLEEGLRLKIELGQHSLVVPELTEAVTRHPLREHLWELLMLALYRSGSQAEALAAYRHVRTLLRDEMGLEPGPGLRDLHQRILESDPSLTGMATGRQRAYELVAPAQLPPPVDGFVGRETEIREIRDSLIPPGQREIINVTGVVGVGKSALAISVCQTLRAWFPDGQLYAELSEDGRRVDPREVLTGFLLAFGVHAPAHDRPLAELSAMWRSVVADRKILVLLDDAHDSAQVMPLLPGSHGCGVLITSWRRLVDVPGLRPVPVGGLRPQEALRLLSGLAGDRRVAEEPEACARLVARCSHHPLPIRVVAARLLGRPYLSVDQVDARVQDDLRQLYAVDEDCEVVDRRYGLALDRLNPELARAAMLFGMTGGRSLDLPAAAALLGLPKTQACRVSEALGNAHFLEIDSKGNYWQAAIVCALMRRYALRRRGVNECKAALDRLSAHLDTVS